MARAFEDVFGIPDAASGIQVAGRTDAWIVSQLTAEHAVPVGESVLTRFRDAYLGHLSIELDKPCVGSRNGVMPGIRPLMAAVAAREDLHPALLTGNYQLGARAKLEHFDLWRYFRGGAFGDTALDRNSLMREAMASVLTHGGPDVPSAHAIVIGDTPLDVACAASAGARSIAVATGNFSSAELRAAGGDVVFEDLADTPAVLAAMDRLGAR
jgi:phosphoglycolate phosphatase-like HAD superfamily hydrolase